MTDWLTARPIAHRGLHDASAGIIENTASAFQAAIAGQYGIECDLQISADGEAMVHHDDALGRLTDGEARLDALTAAELRGVAFKATADRMLTLGELLDLVAGRVTLVLELKSRFDGDERLARRVAHVLRGHRGPVAAMSFDPAPLAVLKKNLPGLCRGLTAQQPGLSEGKRVSQGAYALNVLRARPQFLAYRVQDLQTFFPRAARMVFQRPVLTWTVRTAADRAAAAHYADQIIFEGFRP